MIREILENRSRYRILVPLTNLEPISTFSLSSEDRRRDRYCSHNLLASIYACLLVFKKNIYIYILFYFAEQNKETFLESDPSHKYLAATNNINKV